MGRTMFHPYNNSDRKMEKQILRPTNGGTKDDMRIISGIKKWKIF
jgi:hypothetical protein